MERLLFFIMIDYHPKIDVRVMPLLLNEGKIEWFFLFLYLYRKEAMRGSELGVFQIPNNQAVEKVPVPSLP